MSSKLTIPLLASLLLLAPATALAHSSSVAYSELVVRGRDLDYTFQISATDLYEAVGVDKDRPVTKDEVTGARERLARYLVERVHVTSGGDGCAPELPGELSFLDNADGFFAIVAIRYRCARLITEASVRYDLFFDVDPRHQGIARIAFDEEDKGEQVFRSDARTVTLRRDLTIWDHAREYLLLGVEHIFTGYDHLSFLFGLLVVVGSFGLRGGARRVVSVVTAFTLAHSLTLIASALGWVALPSKIVEPAIALSIAYVGVENLVNRTPRRRWLLTFAFGLVHGFGFASVLREIGLPQRGLLVSLVSFNVGVELGQLAVVAAVLPLLAMIARGPDATLAALVATLAIASTASFFLLRHFGVAPLQLALVCFAVAPLMTFAGRRWGYDRVVRIAGSSTIGLLAALWFIERVTGRVFAGGWLG